MVYNTDAIYHLKNNLNNKIEIKKNNSDLSNSKCIYVKFKDKFNNQLSIKRRILTELNK